MPRYAAVLLDLDGTLIDTVPLICASYAATLATHGLPPRPRDHWLPCVGRPLREVLRAFARDEAHLDALVASYRAYNDRHHDGAVRVFPGMREALGTLREGGARLAVVTSKFTERARHGLAITGLAPLFDAVIGADDCERHKPHPEPVQRALQALGEPPERAVMVGDAAVDLRSGRAAGTATAAVTWGAGADDELRAQVPDHWLDRPEQLLELA